MRSVGFVTGTVLSLAAAIGSLNSLTACRTGNSQIAADAPAAKAPGAFAQLARAEGQALLARYNAYDIQKESEPNNDCQPIVMPANPDVPFRGTAVLFHGFTNCPQQYNQLVISLANKGIQSFVPLAPGHGRAPVPLPPSGAKVINGVSFGTYYGEFLPRGANRDWLTYQRYVDEVNTFVAQFAGDKVVSGLSLGGQLATYAYLSSPGLYTRALLTSPFYGPAGSYKGRNHAKDSSNAVGRVLGDLVYHLEEWALTSVSDTSPLVAKRDYSWGESCYRHDAGKVGPDGKQTIGRRGICDYHIEHLSALVEQGKDLMSKLSALTSNKLPTIQYMFAEWDGAADTRLMRQAAALQQKVAAQDQVRICAYPHYVPHSFFSATDIMDIADPAWLGSFLDGASSFLATGDSMPISAEKSEEVAFDANTNDDTASNFLNRCQI